DSNLLLYHHAQAPYPMRALEEIIGEIDAATKKNDAAALQRLADELEERSEPAAIAEHYFVRGTVCQLKGNNAEALEHYGRTLKLYEGLGNLARVAEVANSLGNTHYYLADYPKALQYYERALQLYEELGEKSGVATVTSNIGNVHSSLGDYPKAIQYYERALQLHEELGKKYGIANVTGNIGVIHANLGNYPKALEHYERALQLREELGAKSDVAFVTSNIGNVHSCLGDYPKAVQYYERALQLHEELGQKSGIASVTGNIGVIHAYLCDYPKALEYFERALQLREELGVKSGLAVATGNIGDVHSRLGDYPKALEYYERALLMHEELGEKSGMARVTGSIGAIHGYLGDYPKALEHYERALLMHEELGEKSGVATVSGNIGDVHSNLNDYPKALEYYERALQLHEELGERRGLAIAVANITNNLVATNNRSEAHAMAERLASIDIIDAEVRYIRATAMAGLAEAESDYDTAHTTYLAALELADKHGLRKQESDAHLELRDLARKRGDFEGYIKHNNEFTRIKEEIAGAEAKLKMAAAEVEQRMAQERREREKERALLYGALPESIVNRMLKGEDVSGDEHAQVTVLFMDIVGFTSLCSKIPPAHVVHLLKAIFAVCDKVSAEHGLTKIKTIGDSYMAASGVPEYQADHAVRAARAGLAMQEQLQALLLTMDPKLGDTTWTKDVGEIRVRIGLHTGAVVAGVVGEERLQYDIWGDTVNVASRMESTSTPGKVHVSQSVAEALQRYATQVQNNAHDVASLISPRLVGRDSVQVKGKGTMKTYWLEGM
ncbi:MAG: tetratricopeptide repeat protein, partial [Deltaproteobacteria bacterium]|nr:tetratricopeptide repeat protein [Candidatus Kapabacteria bacterium]